MDFAVKTDSTLKGRNLTLRLSYLFETLDVPHQDVLTHQFLDQGVGTSVQLGQEAQAETLQPTIRETVKLEYMQVMGTETILQSNSK